MRQIFKKLAIAATATGLAGAIGASVAQTEESTSPDPMATPQEVVVPATPSGQQIYFFRDQGNSPESDPAAHLMLIKHEHLMPVAETTSTTTVAQATTADTTPTADTSTTMPAAADTSNTMSTDTSTASAPADTTPELAPKADRN